MTGGDHRVDETRCGFVENAAHSELVRGVCDRWERALLALVGVVVRVVICVEYGDRCSGADRLEGV